MINIECSSSGPKVPPGNILSWTLLEMCCLFISVTKPHSMLESQRIANVNLGFFFSVLAEICPFKTTLRESLFWTKIAAARVFNHDHLNEVWGGVFLHFCIIVLFSVFAIGGCGQAAEGSSEDKSWYCSGSVCSCWGFYRAALARSCSVKADPDRTWTHGLYIGLWLMIILMIILWDSWHRKDVELLE